MDLELANRVAVITGANSGIGLATAKAFLAEGARVAGVDLETDALEELAQESQVLPVRADLGGAEGPIEAIARVIAEWGQIDVLVNNVGIAPYREGFLSVGDDDWRLVLDVNFMSMVRMCRAAIPHMVERKRGSIVSIASDAGRQPDVFFPDYCVSKSAIIMLSKDLSNEFGPAGIRVNVVSPGPTRTPIWDKPGGFAESIAEAYGMDVESAIDHFAKEVRKLPLGKLGRPQDVANAVVFLASDAAQQVTGSEYCVNGGVVRAA